MDKAQKWLALALCLCLAAAPLFSAAIAAHHNGHDCVGEGCEICLHIAHLQSTFKKLSAALAAIALALAAVCAANTADRPRSPRCAGTLTRLKVKLNN